jgi:regulator of sigma E protease
MEWLLQGVHYVLSFALIISVIVFIHEFGHYFVAKLCGVKIETFSIGFGRELFGRYDRSGTRWKFSLLPLGGYVKMYGDEGAASTPDNDKLEAMSEQEKRISFHYKPLWQKALIVVAGPASNFILTIGIITYFLYSGGMASTEPVVGKVMKDTPAAAAGLKAGDRVLKVDDEIIETFADIPAVIATNLGTPVTLTIERKGETQTLTITPIEFEDKDMVGNVVKRPLIGISSKKMERQNLSFPQAISEATARTYQLCTMSLKFMGQMMVGDRSAKDLKGPVGIAELSGQVTQSGDTWQETVRMILWFIAMLSANLGLINLLPIPMLDGGHLAYYAIEAAQGKPLAKKFQEYSFKVGFALVASLMAFTLFNDMRNLLF